MIQITLQDDQQASLVARFIECLTSEDKDTLTHRLGQQPITALVDGRGLACPMPLLKTKKTLRTVAVGDSIYVVATDPNSQIDLASFCQQAGLDMVLSTHTLAPNYSVNDSTNKPVDANQLEKLDTIFHVIITKTHGN